MHKGMGVGFFLIFLIFLENEIIRSLHFILIGYLKMGVAEGG